jgi:triosephosphate isomerase
MRKPMVAGNWKMHGSRQAVTALLDNLKQGVAAFNAIDIVVLPSFIYLAQAEDTLKNSSVGIGAQTSYSAETGAFTGEISNSMLADLGCEYVLVGHSERRALFNETLEVVAAKFQAAIKAKLTPILCVGETLTERETEQTETVITTQLESVLKAAGAESFQNAVIAYEPVWAIGTGKTATPEQAQHVHGFIRHLLSKINPALANNTRILYGGSVKADNAAGLFAMADIDGALVGGASLDASGFLAICQAAATEIAKVRA